MADSDAGFLDDLARVETRLYNAIGERLRAQAGITIGQFELLRYARDHPGCRVGEMAANFAAGVGAISKGVDRAEQRGWLARRAHPTDGRSSLIDLTPSGAALAAEAERVAAERLSELLGPIDPAALRATAALLADLRASLERAAVGLPVG